MQNITFNIANFGFVPYGQRIAGMLELASPQNFCNLSQYDNNTKYFSNED
jgi:hypothetical protein